MSRKGSTIASKCLCALSFLSADKFEKSARLWHIAEARSSLQQCWCVLRVACSHTACKSSSKKGLLKYSPRVSTAALTQHNHLEAAFDETAHGVEICATMVCSQKHEGIMPHVHTANRHRLLFTSAECRRISSLCSHSK